MRIYLRSPPLYSLKVALISTILTRLKCYLFIYYVGLGWRHSYRGFHLAFSIKFPIVQVKESIPTLRVYAKLPSMSIPIIPANDHQVGLWNQWTHCEADLGFQDYINFLAPYSPTVWQYSPQIYIQDSTLTGGLLWNIESHIRYQC